MSRLMSRMEAEDDDDDGLLEGCPDCGNDTVTDTDDGALCTSCGWRD